MNGFLRGVMNTLLGWLSLLTSSLWGVLTGRENLLSFLGKNWKGLVLALCLIGTAIDLVVYFFRWKPWRVWRSFWLRMHDTSLRRGGTGAAEDAPAPEEDWPAGLTPARVYGADRDGTDPGMPADRPARRHRRSSRSRPEADTYYEPYYPPQWQEPGTLGSQRRNGE
ncbi:MAG: hypothetical protein IKS31_12500 [Clostridia bacterium]|nr:hypothetical protein [Clostridia bacterium]